MDQPKAKHKEVDESFREARKTGGGTNTAGQVEDGCRLTSITAGSFVSTDGCIFSTATVDRRTEGLL